MARLYGGNNIRLALKIIIASLIYAAIKADNPPSYR